MPPIWASPTATGFGFHLPGVSGDERPAGDKPAFGFGLHHPASHPELIDVNVLTNPDWDPKSGTAEFKAAAVRVELVEAPETAGATVG